MLTALATGARFRLAFLLAIFAALSFVAPPAVLAFGHGSATADCMARADKFGHGQIGITQDNKHHGDHSTPVSSHKSSCCELVCMSALVADVADIYTIAVIFKPFPTPTGILISRVAERLDRPPISLRIV